MSELELMMNIRFLLMARLIGNRAALSILLNASPLLQGMKPWCSVWEEEASVVASKSAQLHNAIVTSM